MQLISDNRRALHDYDILERYEAGLVLTGEEIKAIRAKKVNLSGSYGRLQYPAGSSQPEAVVLNLHIGAGSQPTRTRKLLLHRAEIDRLIGKLEEKRLTLIPVRLYLKGGLAKLELGLGKGRQLYSKRDRKKRKDLEREVQRELRGKDNLRAID